MSTSGCGNADVETSSASASAACSFYKKNESPFISLMVIIDDEPKESTVHLEDSITTELKWRGVQLSGKLSIASDCTDGLHDEKLQLFENIIKECENDLFSANVILIRVDPGKAEAFKKVIRELDDRQSPAKFMVTLIFTVGVLVIDDEIKTEDLDFSNKCVWLAKYLARELIVNYTDHLGINNARRRLKTPPIAIFVRETPVSGQQPLSSRLADALSMEPISYVHHRVSYLISQPETIEHLCELAKKSGFPGDDITNGCRIYLRNAFMSELEAASTDVIIIDTLNDIYVDVDGMMEIAKLKASSTFVMEDASDDTVHQILDTIIWMIKRRCHYTDGPFADYFYTQLSLHKEVDTLRSFVPDSLDNSSDADTEDVAGSSGDTVREKELIKEETIETVVGDDGDTLKQHEYKDHVEDPDHPVSSEAGATINS